MVATGMNKEYDSAREKVFYNILAQTSTPMKLARLIKTCLNKTYSKVHTGKLLSDTFPIQNDLKQRALLPALL
jgi:hypothetical protein